MKKLLILSALSSLSMSACLQGDPNPYDNAQATGGTGTGGGAAALRSSTPPGAPISPGSECSTSSTTSVSLTFENRLSKTFSVYWVGFACEEVLYQTLAPLGSYQVDTSVGYPFRLRDETGALLYEYIPSDASAQTIVIE